MSIETIHQLSEKRKKWVETTRENDFEDGIKRFLTDLYPDNAHFIYELLQNAEDAKASEVQFVLNTDSIEFEHNGSQLFSISDVESITSIGNSPKKDDPTSIGKFGVGFKAVFAYTSTPEIKSGEYHFRIRDLVVPETEGLSPRTLDENRTHFLFPFNNPQKPAEKACAEIEKSLRQLDEGALLFLKNIRKIEYRLPDSRSGSLERMEKDGDRIEISVRRPENLAPDSVHYLRFEKVVEVWDEDEGKRKPCRIAVAFGMERGKAQKWKIKQLDKGQVCIYFPAENETSNLRFHLHAPFASTVARNSIRDCPANDELRDHLADLVAESMFAIRDQGLLDVAFLAVLPNDGDNRSSFNQPIQEKLVELFNNEKLTPMKRGGHAAAKGAFKGSAKLSDLIDDKDLARILGDGHSSPLWIKNPQSGSREDNFLYMLEKKEWTTQDLIDKFFEESEGIMKWLAKKNYDWHRRLYVLLSDELEKLNKSLEYNRYQSIFKQERKDKLLNLRIIRCSDKKYRKGKDCFFPSDGVKDDDEFPLVAKRLYSSGKDNSQQDRVCKFLEGMGVSEVEEGDRIKAILKQRYIYEAEIPDTKKYIKDLKRFIKLVEDDLQWRDLFSRYYIFQSKDKKWRKSNGIFLDLPYLDTGLKAYYEALDNDTDRKWALSPKYKESGIELKKIGEFARNVGAQTELEVKEQKIPYRHPKRDYLFSARGERKRNEINTDYTIPAFRDLLYEPNLDKARLIWRTMDSLSSIYLTAKYRKSESGGFNYAASSLVYDLRNAEWVPQDHGESLCFVLPCDASAYHLPEGFPCESSREWIRKIEFGNRRRYREEQERIEKERTTREYQETEKVARNYGLDSVEQLKKLGRLNRENPEAIQEFLQQQEIKKKEKTSNNSDSRKEKIPFHKALCEAFVAPSKDAVDDDTDYGGSVQNPALRRDRTSEDIAVNIAAEGKQENRSYFTTVKKWTKKNDQVRITLIEWYRGQCQICNKTFTQSNGEPYFEGLYLVSHTTVGWIDRVGNVLCLCPWHSAMFQFGPALLHERMAKVLKCGRLSS